MVNHALTTVVLFSIPYAQSIGHSRSTLVNQSTDHGRPSAINHSQSIARSIGALLLEWPTLLFSNLLTASLWFSG